jgi:Rps23 Pro-64 3,4-dihydroxylase Tpa1-like proline 4-hydroxylase
MLTYKTIKVGNQPIHIYDDLMSIDEAKILHNSLLLANYNYLHVSEKENKLYITSKDYKLLQAEISISDFSNMKIGDLFLKAVENYSDVNKIKLERVFSLCSKYGSTDYCHKDYFENGNGISAVYFSNLEWEADWGGEIIFFDEQGNDIAISYKPRRLLIFNGTINHKAGLPTRICKKVRISLNARYGFR